MMSLRKAVLPRGWVRQELGMQGNFPVLLLLKPVRCGSSDSPQARGEAAAWEVFHVAASRSFQHWADTGQVAGNACRMNVWVAERGEAGGIGQVASPPLESLSKSQMAFPLASIPGPWASQRHLPSLGRAGEGRCCFCPRVWRLRHHFVWLRSTGLAGKTVCHPSKPTPKSHS